MKIALDKVLGYYYFMDKSHPMADRCGKVYLHRHEACLMLGRNLKKDECVHHKDGDKTNNAWSNLEIVTASEHARGHHPRIIVDLKPCKHCHKDFRPERNDQIYCSEPCARLGSRLFNISKEELERLVWEKPTTHVAKMFGVTDNAINGRCKLLGIKKPPRGYRRKKETQK